MADVNRGNRPLSPHIQVHRMTQINTMTSILNRVTGGGMLVAAVLIVWWLLAAATGAEAFTGINWFLNSLLGKLILLGSLWALWFHFLGGLKHLYMDTGRGYDIPTSDLMGWIQVVGSFVLTGLSLLIL